MERFGTASHRFLSVRSIFTFVLVVIITTLLSVLISSQTTYAADPEANWSGDAIVYDGHTYNLTTDFKDSSSTIPTDAIVYQSPVQQVDGSTDKKVFILYFSPGVDPPTETTVKFVEFDFSNSNVASNPENSRDVKITVKGEEGLASSCSVDGIGWIVCPVSVFIAQGMDTLFDKVLAPMITVQPSVLGDPNNSMYIAWNVMRDIANIAFVIVFLIIIYSQLTSFGVSNYGLKKLIPRLIIAAILVNVSFIVAALAIDISNILGSSIQNIFIGIRENLFHLTNDDVSGVNAYTFTWVEITGIILAGGGAAVAGGLYVAASGGLWLLIPLLLGLIAVLILVVVVLAARQAIIVILVIIAPLAFVANLLPNTEKWFDKWKDLFFTMLLFFPAFSLVFGGSQLAGQIIIQNAHSGGSVINGVMLLFGMAVQIAPLVITPLILKFSGSLLGRIAQITNNPSKGLLDRNKNWANARADLTKQRNIAGKGNNLNPTRWGAKMVRNNDFRKRRLQDRTNTFKQDGDNLYHDSPKYEKIHTDMAGSELDKNKIQNRNDEHIERLKVTHGSSLYDRAINTQASKENLDAATNRTNEHFNQRRVVSGNPLNASLNNLEASKSRLETSENAKSVYLNQRRMIAGTVLNATVAPLEASTLRGEATQNQYAKMVEDMKTNPGSSLYHIAQGAQSSKENLEASQANVQALFDQRRRTVGTGLNASTMLLENSKAKAEEAKFATAAYVNEVKADDKTILHRNVVRAEEAKMTAQEYESNLARTINDLKVDDTTTLHRRNIRAERAKLSAQLAESQVAQVVEEYKSGEATNPAMSPALQTIMQQMQADNARIAAVRQGTTSAQYVQQSFNSALMEENAANATNPLAMEVLQTAAGVDPNGRTRARANAISQLKKLESEALTNNVTLLSDQAEKEGTTLKNLSKLIFQRHTGVDLPASETQAAQDPSIVEAAMEALSQDGDVSTLRKARMNPSVDQSMLTRVFARNAGTLKAKGGFDLQANPGLANANRETMDVSIASTLGDIAAANIAGQKAGWWADLSAELPRIFNNVESYAYDTDPLKNAEKKGAQKATLKQTYHNLTTALTSPEVLANIGDRIEPTIEMHKFLHAQFSETAMDVDYDLARKGKG